MPLTIGQIVFAAVRTPLIRAAVGILYTLPAGVASYHAPLRLAHLGLPSEAWYEAFTVVGAILVGGTPWGGVGGARAKLEASLKPALGPERSGTIYLAADRRYRPGIQPARALWLRGHPIQAVERVYRTLKEVGCPPNITKIMGDGARSFLHPLIYPLNRCLPSQVRPNVSQPGHRSLPIGRGDCVDGKVATSTSANPGTARVINAPGMLKIVAATYRVGSS